MPFTPEQAAAQFVQRNTPTQAQVIAVIDKQLSTAYTPAKPLAVEFPFVVSVEMVEELRPLYSGWFISGPTTPRGNSTPSSRLMFETQAEHTEKLERQAKADEAKAALAAPVVEKVVPTK